MNLLNNFPFELLLLINEFDGSLISKLYFLQKEDIERRILLYENFVNKISILENNILLFENNEMTSLKDHDEFGEYFFNYFNCLKTKFKLNDFILRKKQNDEQKIEMYNQMHKRCLNNLTKFCKHTDISCVYDYDGAKYETHCSLCGFNLNKIAHTIPKVLKTKYWHR
jgi:hypothetical protein